MSRRTLQLSIVLALLATGLVLLWPRGTVVQPPPAAVAVLQPIAAPAVESPVLASIPSAVESDASPTRAPAAPVPANREDDAELRDATWVSGHVVYPAGTPIDERVEIVARGKPFPNRPLHRARPSADGSFRVAFAPETTAGLLLLESRFLYLESEPVIYAANLPKDVLLEPKLGGVVCGRVLLRDGAEKMRSTVQEAFVRASGNVEGSGYRNPGAVERSSKIAEDLRFELAGLPPAFVYRVGVELEEFATRTRDGIRVKPGEVVDLDLEVLAGATIRGRVVDDKGRAVPGVRVGAMSFGSFGFPGTNAGVKTEDDGTFELRGIYPGKVDVHAGAEGMSHASLELGDVADGEVRTGVELVLTRTLPIAGRVQWRDGSSAARCPIDYTFVLDTGKAKSFGTKKIRSDADGAFRISDLGDGAVALTARARPPTGDDPWLPYWVAHIEGVQPGSESVVLTLGPGGIVRGTVLDEAGKPASDASIHVAQIRSDWPGGVVRGTVPSIVDGTSGKYEISGLFDGEWSVTAEAPGYATSAPRSITIPGDGSPIDIALLRNATLSGDVADTTGQPVANARLSVGLSTGGDGRYQFRSRPGAADVSDESGRFELEAVPPGSVMLSGELKGELSGELYLDVKPGESRAGLKLVLRALSEPLPKK